VIFEDLDVGKNEAARKEMLERTGQMGVPVIEVDGQILLGFNEASLKERLGLS